MATGVAERAGAIALEPLSLETVRGLFAPEPPPCLSLYMPTHRTVPDNRVDRPAFAHLVESLETALDLAHSRGAIERLLKPFRLLAADVRFWQHARDGLAVLAADGRARVFVLSRPVAPLATVAPRFHTLPLLRLAAAHEDFDVLSLTSRVARVFTGSAWHDPSGTSGERLDPVPLVCGPGAEPRESLDRGDVVDAEVFEAHRVRHGEGPAGRAAGAVVHGGFGSKRDDIDADTEIFLRAVDRVVDEQVSRRTGRPLVLVAAGRLAATFRGLSRNPLLLEEHVDTDPHLRSPAELARIVLPVFARFHAARIDCELKAFAQARDRDRAVADLADVARAAVAGRVATLFVEADRFEPGRIDRATGAIAPATPAGVRPADRSRSGDLPAVVEEDLVGAVAEEVLVRGGAVVAVDRIAMPTETGVAAIERY
jgi:hypothetical protein